MKDYTRHLQAANDEINLGNLLRQVKGPLRTMENLSPSGECEEGKLEERRCDSMSFKNYGEFVSEW